MNFPSLFTSRPAAVLTAVGQDVFPFLQGQFTQDLKPQNAPRCAYGLWLNQKGRVVADSFALADGDRWRLFSFFSPVQTLRERLQAYIIADDVELSDETESWTRSTLWGAGTTAWLQDRGATIPPEGEWAAAGGGLLFRGRRGLPEAWEWLRPASFADEPLLDELPRVEQAEYERARILAGVVEVPADIGPGELPNEGALEREAISYSKGCYLGQEVMARLHMQGQVRRRLFRVRGSGEVADRAALLSPEGKRVGELRSTAPAAEGAGFVGFALVSLLGLDPAKPLTVEGDPAIEVTILDEVS